MWSLTLKTKTVLIMFTTANDSPNLADMPHRVAQDVTTLGFGWFERMVSCSAFLLFFYYEIHGYASSSQQFTLCFDNFWYTIAPFVYAAYISICCSHEGNVNNSTLVMFDGFVFDCF